MNKAFTDGFFYELNSVVKQASTPTATWLVPLLLAGLGSGTGALVDKKNRRRGAITGGLTGALLGLAGNGYSHWRAGPVKDKLRQSKNDYESLKKSVEDNISPEAIKALNSMDNELTSLRQDSDKKLRDAESKRKAMQDQYEANISDMKKTHAQQLEDAASQHAALKSKADAASKRLKEFTDAVAAQNMGVDGNKVNIKNVMRAVDLVRHSRNVPNDQKVKILGTLSPSDIRVASEIVSTLYPGNSDVMGRKLKELADYKVEEDKRKGSIVADKHYVYDDAAKKYVLRGKNTPPPWFEQYTGNQIYSILEPDTDKF